MSSHASLRVVSALLLVSAGCGMTTAGSDATDDDTITGADADADSDADVAIGSDSATDADLDAPADGDGDSELTDDPSPPPEPCAGGPSGWPSDSPNAGASVTGNGGVELDVPVADAIVAFETTLVVPPMPAAVGTVFLWPGLQPLPGGAAYDPIDNGVLQPVLTWGPTCAPNAPAGRSYASWWVSAQYVNTVGMEPGYTGCQGGVGMSVQPGDALHIVMALTGTTWSQTVTDDVTGEEVNYAIDLQGQAQARALFAIEDYDGGNPAADIVFQDTRITFDAPVTDSCQPLRRGVTDDFTAPRASLDGTQCCIGRVVLRVP